MTVCILLAGFFSLLLAFGNGANDNSKTVATLIGSRTLSLNRAVWFAAAAILLAGELVRRFSGQGIVDAALAGQAAFAASVGLAAALTVGLATIIGMPISTTHAMVGAIVGIGVSTGALHWQPVLWKFLLPLLGSPLIAVSFTSLLYIGMRAGRRFLGVTEQTCLCVGREYQPVNMRPDGTMVLSSSGLKLGRDEMEQCQNRYVGRFIGVDAQRILDVCHVTSAGALSFARGLNDTPKIAALLVAAGVINRGFAVTGGLALMVSGIAIAAGGLLAVRRVAMTMSYRITAMNDGQGLTANLGTAFLVIWATKFGLPVSTTHVSCGSLFGIGLVNGRAHGSMIGTILLAWVTTLPVAAIFGVAAWGLLGG